jgi:hypothetical protein
MNRAIALFVALAMLLAHTLAIHDDGLGRFAFPYDQAYVALRLARNLVYDGQMAWNPGSAAFESYPSALWIAVCSAAERAGPALHVSINLLVQGFGIACALGTLVVLSRFRVERVASLIAPLFLAASGAFAAAAANGLETAAFTLLLAGSFYALERGRSGWLALLLSLACLARPEGAYAAAALAVVRAFGQPNEEEGGGRRAAWGAFAAPALVFALTCALRWWSTGFLLSPELVALVQPLPGQLREGLVSLREFALVTVTPLLLVFPAAYLVRGALSRTGAHAVFLALAWTALCALRGRGPLPFDEAMVPALPFLCVAVQEGIIAALDGVSALRRRLTLLCFGAALAGSVLASRTPADLGPIPFEQLHTAWVRPASSARFGCEQPLGRLGLQEEIAVTGHLRKLGIFLRDQVEQGASVLTPWPGAIGYLSRQVVHDVLGRTDPREPLDRPRSWSRRERADVVAVLRAESDYVVPFCRPRADLPTLRQVAQEWLDGLDLLPGEAGRLEQIEAGLARFELCCVPIEDLTRERASIGREASLLLRRRDLGYRPRLELALEEGRLRVAVRHAHHPQIAELDLRLADDSGRVVTLRPTGEVDPAAKARARAALLLYDSGTRAVELLRTPLPPAAAGRRWVRARAQLMNPGAPGSGDPWEAASEPVEASL